MSTAAPVITQEKASNDAKSEAAIRSLLSGRRPAPSAPASDGMHDVEIARGRRAKTVLDGQRSNTNYYRTQHVHAELLHHYENVDWYERDTRFDFDAYMDSNINTETKSNADSNKPVSNNGESQGG